MGVGFAWKPFRECSGLPGLVSRGARWNAIKPAGPSAVPHPTPTSESGDNTADRQVTRRDPRHSHATRRRTLAILAALPGLNLKKQAFEEGEQPGASHSRIRRCGGPAHAESQSASTPLVSSEHPGSFCFRAECRRDARTLKSKCSMWVGGREGESILRAQGTDRFQGWPGPRGWAVGVRPHQPTLKART